MLCYVMSRYVMLCYVMLRYVMLCYVMLCYVMFWRNSSQGARASSFTRFLDHTQRHTTFGRTPLDERSTHRRDLYLTTHNTHNRQKDHAPSGIRTHNLSKRAAADLRGLEVFGKGKNLLLPQGFKSVTEGRMSTSWGPYSLRMELPASHTLR